MSGISPSLPYGYTIFCDDVRRELAAKSTFVGVYDGELRVFGKLPLILPKLVAVVSFFEEPGDGGEPLELRIHLPEDSDEEPSKRAEYPPRNHDWNPDLPRDGQQFSLKAIIEFCPLEIKQYGRLRVRMKRGDEIYRLGSIMISELTRDEAEAIGVQLPPDQPAD